jgi:hypothetical protein
MRRRSDDGREPGTVDMVLTTRGTVRGGMIGDVVRVTVDDAAIFRMRHLARDLTPEEAAKRGGYVRRDVTPVAG